jgi:hypothetical protein
MRAPEPSLEAVMRFIPHSTYDWDFNRHGAWIEWIWHNQRYRLATFRPALHDPHPGFAGLQALTQLTEALQHLADLLPWGSVDHWFAPFHVTQSYRPCPLPACFAVLGFTTWPESPEAVKQAYYTLVHTHHPDHGGSHDTMVTLNAALHDALAHWS